jgi:hypothetical protein
MESDVEKIYQFRIASLSPCERFERSATMLKWTRDLLARTIIQELGIISEERLKWEVAKRMYGASPAAEAIIAKRLADVSG